MTYKALGRSILNYGVPVWGPFLSNTSWQELQIAQNSALRSITGCVLMSDQDHLHNETQILPVKEHSEMLSKQYMISMHQQHHPNRWQLTKPCSTRDIKKSLLHKHKKDIQVFVSPDQIIDKKQCKQAQKAIHTSSVKDTINNFKASKVTNKPAPRISNDEKQLPRETRVKLAQLRSGYSTLLNSYMLRINKSDTDLCKTCNEVPETSMHLFNCKENPTELTADSLWNSPLEAATFLGLKLRASPAESEPG